MNYVKLTFHWGDAQSRSYTVVADSEPTPESLKATIAAILELFKTGDSLLMTDRNDRAFCVLPLNLTAIEAEKTG
jgi:hypothetical protein